MTWFLLQFGAISTHSFFETKNCSCPAGSFNFVVFEKINPGYVHQIVLEIMLLPYKNRCKFVTLNSHEHQDGILPKKYHNKLK